MRDDSELTHTHAKSGRKRLYISLTALLVLALAVTAAWYFLWRETDPFPSDIERDAKVALYYPKGLPVNPDTIELSNADTLLTYTTKYGSSEIYVTIQPKLEYFDNAGFQKGIKEASEIVTPNGVAVVGQLGGRTIGNLSTTDAWILASTADKSGSSNIAETLKLLTKD